MESRTLTPLQVFEITNVDHLQSIDPLSIRLCTADMALDKMEYLRCDADFSYSCAGVADPGLAMLSSAVSNLECIVGNLA